MFSLETVQTRRSAKVAAFLVLVCACTVSAQQRGVQRIARRDSDDLSKFLIETESRSNRGSMFYRPSAIDTNRIDVAAIRTVLTRFAEDANRLYRQIEQESTYNPRLRAMKSDALKLRARSLMLSQDIRENNNLQQFSASVREVDSDWHRLSHSIKQVPQVPDSITTTLAAMDRSNKQVERAFQFEPQIDRRELLTQVMAMRADFDNLIDDIELELGNTQDVRAMVRSVRSIRQQSAYAADLIAEQGEYDRIIEAYKRAEDDWKPIAQRLATSDSRYIQRSVRRIVSAGNNLKQLLWLEHETDMSQLVETANGMRKHVDQFFLRTPLLLILKLDDPHSALRSANHFLDACDVYTDQVRGNADQETLMEVFNDLQVTGADFVQVFRPLPSKTGQLVLADIRRDLTTLQEQAHSHNQTDGFDRLASTDLAAEIETLAEHIDYDLRHWLRNSNSSRGAAALRLSKQFQDNTRRLHMSLMNRATPDQLRQETSAVYEDWRRLSPILRQAPEEDRQHMNSISTKLTRAIVDLMLPLGL